ncbi:MAG: ASPIC/UnbV domain-containing protein, partial [Wenzhouxiangellaceae bacterium]
ESRRRRHALCGGERRINCSKGTLRAWLRSRNQQIAQDTARVRTQLGWHRFAVAERAERVEGQSVGVHLVGGAGLTRDALGARVEVTTPDGVQWRELRLGESRGANHQPILHFGLGAATEAEVRVEWPNGRSADFGSLPAGQTHTLIYDPGVLFGNSFETAP